MKLLVSSCLLGQNVKYDGWNNQIHSEVFEQIISKCEVFTFCPEVEGGLSTPRAKAEIKSFNPIKVETIESDDVTEAFVDGAQKLLELCLKENITIALMKSKSPSCGNNLIYNGAFDGTLIKESGVAARLLLENGIKVYNEKELTKLDEALKKIS